jgi:hypothetical protein
MVAPLGQEQGALAFHEAQERRERFMRDLGERAGRAARERDWARVTAHHTQALSIPSSDTAAWAAYDAAYKAASGRRVGDSA